MRPQEFLARIQGSEVVRKEQDRLLSTTGGAGVPKEEYEVMMVGKLVERELKHISLFTEE